MNILTRIKKAFFRSNSGIAEQPLHAMSEEEFKATFHGRMVDVTTKAGEVVEFWPYAERALRATFPEACSCDWKVASVYECADGTHQHVLIPSHVSNLYLVVVVDKRGKKVLGHHRLDLGVLYGLREAQQALPGDAPNART